MRQYNIEQLKKDRVVFSYTPFSQASIMERFDEDWKGSCYVMAYQWIYHKVRNGKKNFSKPVYYEINDPSFPHPVIVGDNDASGPDISAIRKSLGDAYKHETVPAEMIEMLDDDGDEEEAINNESSDSNSNMLADYIGSKKYHFCVIGIGFNILTDSDRENAIQSGHAVAFVKMSDKVSFFDPNNGEITFKKFEDFKKWFAAETREGCLRYITHFGKFYYAVDLFPRQIFQPVDQELQQGAEEKEGYDNTKFMQILQQKEEARESKFLHVFSCIVRSYFGKKYVCPEEVIQDPKFKVNEVDYHTGKDKVPKEEEGRSEQSSGMAGFTYHHDETPIPRPMPRSPKQNSLGSNPNDKSKESR
ncbi:MAG: hemophilus virulence surface antigen [Rickettsiaceae bacterium]|jgi:hypothetical protein|nr:hemophilus virulence surface antigen [Rickettsiaceae bacterium]